MNRRKTLKLLTTIGVSQSRIIMSPQRPSKSRIDEPAKSATIRPPQEPSISDWVEIVEIPIYDCLELTPNQSEFTFFVQGLGTYLQDGSVKFITKTNNYTGGILPAPCEFLIDKIFFVFMKHGKLLGIFQDSIWTRSFLSLQVENKTYAEGQAWMFAHPFCALNAPSKWNRLNFGVTWQKPFDPILIRQRTHFTGKLYLDPTIKEPRWEAMLILDGKLARQGS